MNSLWTQKYANADVILGSGIKNWFFDNTVYSFFNIRLHSFDTSTYFHLDERMNLHFQIVLLESIDMK